MALLVPVSVHVYEALRFLKTLTLPPIYMQSRKRLTPWAQQRMTQMRHTQPCVHPWCILFVMYSA